MAGGSDPYDSRPAATAPKRCWPHGDRPGRSGSSCTSVREKYADEWIGLRVGAYRLVSRVGEGGMGAVFRAVRDDDQFQQTVAIKLLRFGGQNRDGQQRFRVERQILASLEHPNISRLLDGGEWVPPGATESQPFIVMEYVEGVPITTYCFTHNLPIATRLELFRRVCDALSYAHQQLIIHRDVKPGNILVTPDGTPKLLDFGIAKLLDAPADAAQTLTGVRLMTPDYASPEQVRGGAISTVTDVYALGAVLYELLTGNRAHQITTTDPSEIFREVCERDVRAPSTWGDRQLRGDLDIIVLKALQKEPVRRYQSVEQLSEDARRYLAGLPIRGAARYVHLYRDQVCAAAVAAPRGRGDARAHARRRRRGITLPGTNRGHALRAGAQAREPLLIRFLRSDSQPARVDRRSRDGRRYGARIPR